MNNFLDRVLHSSTKYIFALTSYATFYTANKTLNRQGSNVKTLKTKKIKKIKIFSLTKSSEKERFSSFWRLEYTPVSNVKMLKTKRILAKTSKIFVLQTILSDRKNLVFRFCVLIYPPDVGGWNIRELHLLIFPAKVIA